MYAHQRFLGSGWAARLWNAIVTTHSMYVYNHELLFHGHRIKKHQRVLP